MADLISWLVALWLLAGAVFMSIWFGTVGIPFSVVLLLLAGLVHTAICRT